MPNWCSNSLEADSVQHGKEFWRTIRDFALAVGTTGGFDEDVTDADLDNGAIIKIEKFFGRFLQSPPELQGIISGGPIEIDGKRVHRWREDVDGNPVAIPAEELQRYVREYGAADWYDWNRANWGTKWDCTAQFDPSIPRLTFDTAWGPPTEFLLALSRQFPRVIFELAYCEGGMGFFGSDTVQDGETVSGVHWGNGIYQEGLDWEEIDDPYDALTPAARQHCERFGLHTGG